MVAELGIRTFATTEVAIRPGAPPKRHADAYSVGTLGLRSTSGLLRMRVADLGVVATARARADTAKCPLCRRAHDFES